MSDIFMKTENNSETKSEKLFYIMSENKGYTNKKNTEYLNTEGKINSVLTKLAPGYNDVESLQTMLDETLRHLEEQEKETDKYKLRFNEALKVMKNQKEKIDNLTTNESLLQEEIEKYKNKYKDAKEIVGQQENEICELKNKLKKYKKNH